MNDARDNEYKPLVKICWVMAGVLALLLGVIAWQLWQKRPEKVPNQAAVVTDTTAPVFKDYLETVEMTVGTAFDLASYARAVDETDGEVAVSLSGEYDLDDPGEYQLNYVARDQSGNAVRQAFTLRVVGGEAGQVRIIDRTFETAKGFQAQMRNGVTTVDGVMIVNKTYDLPEDYGADLEGELTAETQVAFEEMRQAAELEDLELEIVSGFRLYETQASIFARYVRREGEAAAENYAERPGHSEHQTGLAIDINMTDTSLAETAEGRWLAEHAWEYGFILRYPDGQAEATGYEFEPWHFRYVGRDLAGQLYNNGDWRSLEEYFGLTG